MRGGAPYVNLGGYQSCEEKYSDGGHKCTSSNDCQGSCFLPWGWAPNSHRKPIGSCAHDNVQMCTAIEHSKTAHGGCLEE